MVLKPNTPKSHTGEQYIEIITPAWTTDKGNVCFISCSLLPAKINVNYSTHEDEQESTVLIIPIYNSQGVC